MAKDPAFLFYPGDWLGGTQSFTRAHKGAYMDLLMAQHSEGHMSEVEIHHILGNDDFKEMWPKLKKKFIQDSNGLFFNEKLENEILKRKKFTESRKKNLSHMDNHMNARMENGIYNSNNLTNSHEVYNSEEFEIFWNLYDKKVGDKIKLEKKWHSLKPGERTAAMLHIPKYKLSQPDKKYRKNPQTYLNNKSWNDEIIENGTHIQTANTDHSNAKQGTSKARIEAARNF